MIRYENHCVGCLKEMGCLGSACPYVDVPVVYCDKCGYEIDDEDIDYDAETHYCSDCMEKEDD